MLSDRADGHTSEPVDHADRPKKRLDALKGPRVRQAAIVVATGLLILLAALPWLGHSGGTPAVAPTPTPVPTPVPAATPWRLQVSSLHLAAPLTAVPASDAGVFDQPPSTPDLGWWAQSAEPGSTKGQTMIAGHTPGPTGGRLDKLGTVKKGAEVRIVSAKQTIIYNVTAVHKLSESDVNKQVVTLFDQTNAKNRLVLIASSGWTGSGYRSNVFVYAQAVRVIAARRAA